MFVRVHKNHYSRPKLAKPQEEVLDRPNANTMIGLNTHIQKEPTHTHVGHTIEGGAILDLRGSGLRGGAVPLLLKNLNFNKQASVIKGKGFKKKYEPKEKIEKIRFEF
jgi:hypothetical protein